MEPAPRELASTKEDGILTASDIASLPEGRQGLQRFAHWLQEDREVQSRVADSWNDLVREDQHRGPPRNSSVQSVSDSTTYDDDWWSGVSACNYDHDPEWILESLMLPSPSSTS